MKLDPIRNERGLGLRTCIVDHALANIYPHQRHRWIGLGGFHDPATSPTSDIEHALKAHRVGLL